MASNTAPLAHSIPAACERLGIGRTTIYELIKAGELRPFKIGRKTLIPESDLVRLIAARVAANDGEARE